MATIVLHRRKLTSRRPSFRAGVTERGRDYYSRLNTEHHLLPQFTSTGEYIGYSFTGINFTNPEGFFGWCWGFFLLGILLGFFVWFLVLCFGWVFLEHRERKLHRKWFENQKHRAASGFNSATPASLPGGKANGKRTGLPHPATTWARWRRAKQKRSLSGRQTTCHILLLDIKRAATNVPLLMRAIHCFWFGLC